LISNQNPKTVDILVILKFINRRSERKRGAMRESWRGEEIEVRSEKCEKCDKRERRGRERRDTYDTGRQILSKPYS
jgi:hypothetical protein